MPSYGETKTVVTKKSKSQIQSQIGVLGIITDEVIADAIKFLSGAALISAKATLGASVLGVTVTTGILVGLKEERSKLKGYLEAIKKNKAKGIVVKVPYQYRYMNGSGTGWYIVGRVTVSTYN